MGKSLEVIITPELTELEARIKQLEDERNFKTMEINRAKERIAEILKGFEAKNPGKSYTSTDWSLCRTGKRKSHVISITQLRQWVTREVIDRCTMTRWVEAPLLNRRRKK